MVLIKRKLSAEQVAVLRRILTGAHPSPGSEYLGWPQYGTPNRKFFDIVLRADMNEINIAARRLKEMRKRYRKSKRSRQLLT